MGLFTNRKKKRDSSVFDDDDMVDPARALGVHGDLWSLDAEPDHADPVDHPDRALSDSTTAVRTAEPPQTQESVERTESRLAETELADMGISIDVVEPPIPPGPRRRREDHDPATTPSSADNETPPDTSTPDTSSPDTSTPDTAAVDTAAVDTAAVDTAAFDVHAYAALIRTHGSNVAINETGLLEILGLESGASLVDVGDARTRFLADHDPRKETDPEAAALKRQIRRGVNRAYASFRLMQAD